MTRWLLVLVMIVATGCGGDARDPAIAALDPATSATAQLLELRTGDPVGAPVPLSPAQLDALRALVRKLPPWPNYKCAFDPIVRVDLVGPKGSSIVEICFGCGEVQIVGAGANAARWIDQDFDAALAWARGVFPDDPTLATVRKD